MEVGQTVARRYALVSEEPSGVTGVTRYVATDTRLHTDVTVLHVDTVAPTAVVRRAQRMLAHRDRRLARVIAAGFEGHGGDREAYVVTARPQGTDVASLVGVVPFAPSTAGALIGAVASTLAGPAAAGIHHGFLRAECLTVTPKGRVIVEGLGFHGELAMQAGEGHGDTERADALALAGLYLTALTGLPSADVTPDDLPDDLPDAARDLAETAIRGSGPTTIAALVDALGRGDVPTLRDMAAEAPRLWWSYEMPLDTPPTDTVAGTVEMFEAPDVEGEFAVDIGDIVEVEGAVAVGGGVDTDEPVADTEAIEVVPETEEADPGRPRTFFDKAVDDLDEFEDIVTEQNAVVDRSVAETALTWLHERFPQSAPLARAAAAAHARAQTPAPFAVGPLLLALALVVVFIAGLMALQRLQEPFVPDFDVFDHPPQEYPQYTFSPSPTPTPDADA